MQPAETTRSFKWKPFALDAQAFCGDKGFHAPPNSNNNNNNRSGQAEAPGKTPKELILDQVYISLIKLPNCLKEVKLKIVVSLEALEK